MGSLHPLVVRLPDPLPSTYLLFEDFGDFRLNPRLKWSEPAPVDFRIVDHCMRAMPVRDAIAVNFCVGVAITKSSRSAACAGMSAETLQLFGI